ncbi:hypothetical protein I7I53_04198 [Histoplasma capsulatum var. duboisii H88]|uniref:Uncharacterized protein n=1 Tax=Ajellomyces capsulatus (strain H88) TaxID=544711 RepID=A0A8A1LQL8_AJEC8|nr:hypothetical protein I7I53_04198 [Histoplasma capsulatum var. duboisii H88]
MVTLTQQWRLLSSHTYVGLWLSETGGVLNLFERAWFAAGYVASSLPLNDLFRIPEHPIRVAEEYLNVSLGHPGGGVTSVHSEL